MILLGGIVNAGWFEPEAPPGTVINNMTDLVVNSITAGKGNFTGDVYMNNNTIWDAVFVNATFLGNNTNISHNSLFGLQGGTPTNEYYHLNQSIYDKLLANINEWINNTSLIPPIPKWNITGSKYMINDSGILDLNETQLNITFNTSIRQMSGNISVVGGSGSFSTSNYGVANLIYVEGPTHSEFTVLVNDNIFNYTLHLFKSRNMKGQATSKIAIPFRGNTSLNITNADIDGNYSYLIR